MSISGVNRVKATQPSHFKPMDGSLGGVRRLVRTIGQYLPIVEAVIAFNHLPISLLGCGGDAGEELCEIDSPPIYPKEGMAAVPAEIKKSELKKGVEVTWKAESQPALTLCSGNTDRITTVCRFKDGDVEFSNDKKGRYEPKKMLYEELFSPVTCKITSYYNPIAGKSITYSYDEENPFTWKLYGFDVIKEETTSEDVCKDWPSPKIDETTPIEIEPSFPDLPASDVPAGAMVRFSFPRDKIYNCNGDPDEILQAYFTLDDEKVNTFFDEAAGEYYFETSFNQPSGSNPHKVALWVIDPSRSGAEPVSKVIDVYVAPPVKAPNLSIKAPAAVDEDIPFDTSVGAPDTNFNYCWNFGDGKIPFSCGETVSHTYSDPGNYAVILEATHKDYPDYIFTSKNNPYYIFVKEACDGTPLIDKSYPLKVEPSANVMEGEIVKFSYPMDKVTECDGTTDSLLIAFFIIDGQEFPATIKEINGKKYYYYETSFKASPNAHVVALKVVDTSRPDAEPAQSEPVDVYVAAAAPTLCQQTFDQPQVGALSINPSSINPKGQIVYGSPVTFDLPNTTDCDGEPSDLSVTLQAGNSQVPMVKKGNLYSATVNAAYWGTPISATVTDKKRNTSATSSLWSLPPIVSPELPLCQANPKPKASTVDGPNPPIDYDINSNQPVTWKIYTKNCDGSTDKLSAVCDFGPLGTVPGSGDPNGIITISKALTQKLGGSFTCDITGKNNEALDDGAILYPPYYLSPIVAPTLCQQTFNKPQVGALSINPSSINPKGQIIYGSPVTFDLPNTTDCDGEPSDLSVTLQAGNSPVSMAKKGNIYSATINAAYWGAPISATVVDNFRNTSATSSLWSLPPIVSPELSACQANPKPKASTVDGPNPPIDYDINSNQPVTWKIYTKNCDGSTDKLSAVCDFGPLGTVPGSGDPNGIITISKALTQKLGGSFTCDITGSNNEVLDDGAILYPPYYLSPIVAPTLCQQTFNKPQVGALSINPSSINPKGQIIYGSPVTFDLPNTTDCDGEPSDLSVTLYAGNSPVPMPKNGSIYSATINAAYWGAPINATVVDNFRNTSATSSLWSLPPIVSPELSACQANPRPKAFTVDGPKPPIDYDINSGTPVTWEIYTKNCDGSTNGLSAVCDFGPLGPVSGSGNLSGIITISKALTQKLGGSFPCDITGSNNEILDDGAIIYPPYYKAP